MPLTTDSSKYQADLKQLDNLLTKFDLTTQKLEHIQIPTTLVQAAARKALNDIKPRIKQMVLSNFNSSDMSKQDSESGYKHTNKIKNAVMNMDIGGRFDPGKPWKIWIMYPENVAPYVYNPHPQPGRIKKGKKREVPFYKVASSLNYGAVIPPANLTHITTAKAKQQIKKTAERIKSIAPGLFSGYVEGEVRIRKSVGTASYKVIDPKKFFWLSSGQMNSVVSMFIATIKRYIGSFLMDPAKAE